MTMTGDRPAQMNDAGRMTIWEHIAELRTRIIKCVVAFVIGSTIGFFLWDVLLEVLKAPYLEVNPDAQLWALTLTEGFAIRLQTAMYLGVAMAMPVILWQIWRFVTPGLYPHEKRYAVPFTVSAMILFLFGVVLAYISLPATIGFLTDIAGEEVTQITSVESYLKFALFMMLAFGAGFEFPVLLVALQFAGVLNYRKLLGWWRYATLVIVGVAAVITPGGDPVTMLLLAVPMEILYFISIGLGVLISSRRSRRNV